MKLKQNQNFRRYEVRPEARANLMVKAVFSIKKLTVVLIILAVFDSCTFRKAATSMQELNFEVFWQTFEDNYAFFELKGVDWKETYAKHRPNVSAETSDDELFQILTEMVRPLKDGHIHIEGHEDNYFNDWGNPSVFHQEFSNDSLRRAFWSMVSNTLLQDGFSPIDSIGFEVDGEKLFHYAKSDDIGYFRFLRSDPTGGSYTGPDLIQIRKDLNVIFEDFKELKGLIVDVRLHRGGYPEFSMEVAARFTEEKTVSRHSHSRISGAGYEDFDSLTTHFIEPKQLYATEKFLKPVIMLTNEGVGSAGETFVMSMKQFPNVTSVGSNTAGILSFMYEFNLPNGWWVSLSNTRTYAADMELYEGIGIPVDHEVLNSTEDLRTGIDPVVAKALELLRVSEQ